MSSKLKRLLDWIFKYMNIYFYIIDNNNSKIIIFTWNKIVEASLLNSWNTYKKTDNFYFSIRDFSDINHIYSWVNSDNNQYYDIDLIIGNFIKYEILIKNIFLQENVSYLQKSFNKIKLDKKVLFIVNWFWIQETIENAFLSFCQNSNINLTILYRFWEQWWKKLNYSWFFNELKNVYKNFRFIYNEDIDDALIDSIIDEDTEVFSLQYDYKWKHENINLITWASVSDEWVYWRYKNIFSSFKSQYIWYSTNIFLNTENTKIYNFFNPQNIQLLENISILTKIDNFVLSGGMSWSRDFSILKKLDLKWKWVLISDNIHEMENFLGIPQIKSYYWFLWAFALSSFFIHTPKAEFSNDDRHKMLATSICSWKPVIVPYNDWLIVKEIMDNKLGLVYKNWDVNDLKEKIAFFLENPNNLETYSKNCIKYSKINMDVNGFMNFIFDKTFR